MAAELADAAPKNERPKCRGCGGPSRPRFCVCTDCWWSLPRATTIALACSDASLRAEREEKLFQQISDGVPLAQIEVDA